MILPSSNMLFLIDLYQSLLRCGALLGMIDDEEINILKGWLAETRTGLTPTELITIINFVNEFGDVDV